MTLMLVSLLVGCAFLIFQNAKIRTELSVSHNHDDDDVDDEVVCPRCGCPYLNITVTLDTDNREIAQDSFGEWTHGEVVENDGYECLSCGHVFEEVITWQ